MQKGLSAVTAWQRYISLKLQNSHALECPRETNNTGHMCSQVIKLAESSVWPTPSAALSIAQRLYDGLEFDLDRRLWHVGKRCQLGRTPSRRIRIDRRVHSGHRDGEHCGLDTCHDPETVRCADHTSHREQPLPWAAVSTTAAIFSSAADAS